MTDTSAVSVAPVVDTLVPYIQVIVPILVTAILGWVATAIQKATGYTVSDSMKASVAGRIDSYAGAAVAKSATNLATETISVTNPIVKEIVANVMADLSPAIQHLGWTPDVIALKVQGAIGKLQASSAVVTPVATGATTGVAGNVKVDPLAITGYPLGKGPLT